MCDFIISIGARAAGPELLKILKRLHISQPPQGRYFDFDWGSMAVLDGIGNSSNNHLVLGSSVIAWVGDLVTTPTAISSLAFKMQTILRSPSSRQVDLYTDSDFQKLNGAFAIVFVDKSGLAAITDPLALTQIFAGYDKFHNITTLGSHSDLTAAIADDTYSIDMVSIAEFLNRGTACFPYTMHQNVRKLCPGSAYCVRISPGGINIESLQYWKPPEENTAASISDLTHEFVTSFKAAVEDRCGNSKTGITLSGGLDSRLVLATMPPKSQCLAFTFCDKLNREARTAYRVAKAYQRPWLPLYRDKEYLARTVVQNVRFAGCECDWIHGHAVGLSDSILRHGIDTVLSGYLMDTFFRGYFAGDIEVKQRFLGLLDPVCVSKPYDWANRSSNFADRFINPELLEQAFVRRRSYYQTHSASQRGSIVEWLDVYPFSQRPEIGTWATERRTLPLRIVAMDRRLLEFSFSCPAQLRASGKIFSLAAAKLFGPGAYIPNANNGTRPASSRLGMLIDRKLRRMSDRIQGLACSVGFGQCIQHSWHDYQQIWLSSPMMKKLVMEYNPHLSQFEGLLFDEKLSPLHNPESLDWRNGFRLLALGIWKSALSEYRLELAMSRLTKPVEIKTAAPVTIPEKHQQTSSINDY